MKAKPKYLKPFNRIFSGGIFQRRFSVEDFFNRGFIQWRTFQWRIFSVEEFFSRGIFQWRIFSAEDLFSGGLIQWRIFQWRIFSVEDLSLDDLFAVDIS